MALVTSIHCSRGTFLKQSRCLIIHSAGLKNIKRPINYDHIQLPEKPRLPFVDKIPQFIGSIKTPRTTKRLDLLRGPELVHTTLIHKQYGIVAMRGGRMAYKHFENLRMVVMKNMDIKKMFAVWRVDSPWLPVTKKGVGQRMGGGKGAIDHYVTPVRQGRIILEIGGRCEYKEALPLLQNLCARMPFPCIPCNEEVLQEMKDKEVREKEENINPYTYEYMIKNNMGGCRRWISNIVDYKYFGKYL